jgi:hypothetical protein
MEKDILFDNNQKKLDSFTKLEKKRAEQILSGGWHQWEGRT